MSNIHHQGVASKETQVDIETGWIPGQEHAQADTKWQQDGNEVYEAALQMADAEIKAIDSRVLLAAVSIAYSKYIAARNTQITLKGYNRMNSSMFSEYTDAQAREAHAWAVTQRLLLAKN